MAFVRPRVGTDGKVRYQALYDNKWGKRRSAGTFDDDKRALKEAILAEGKESEGGTAKPRQATLTFQAYVEGTWLPNHTMALSTRADYMSAIRRHIMPTFGPMKMREIWTTN
jgi:hypothetical protein